MKFYCENCKSTIVKTVKVPLKRGQRRIKGRGLNWNWNVPFAALGA
jgi:hypothetical protein